MKAVGVLRIWHSRILLVWHTFLMLPSFGCTDHLVENKYSLYRLLLYPFAPTSPSFRIFGVLTGDLPVALSSKYLSLRYFCMAAAQTRIKIYIGSQSDLRDVIDYWNRSEMLHPGLNRTILSISGWLKRLSTNVAFPKFSICWSLYSYHQHLH